MSDETMLEEIERLQVTVRDLWQERTSATGGGSQLPTIADSEIAAAAYVDLDTVRAFLVSENGRGLTITGVDGALTVTAVELGYGEGRPPQAPPTLSPDWSAP